MGQDEDEVDPDAATVMPAARRDEPSAAGPAVAVRAGDEVVSGSLAAVSLTGELTILADSTLPVDAVVVVRTKGKQKDPIESDGVIIWTRSQGPQVVLGISLKGDDTSAWDRLLP